MKTIKVVVAAVVLGGVGACATDEAQSYEVTFDEAEQAATQADVWTQTWNGGSAGGWFWGTTGSGYLDAFEYKTRDSRSAYVNFSVGGYDPTSLQCFTETWFGETWEWCWYTRYTYSYGWGAVPASDVKLNPNSARVKTTLGANFYGTQCTHDWVSWQYTCAPLAGGAIDVSWSKDGFASQFNSGTTQQSYGPYTFKSQGSFRSSSATLSGSILGVDILGGGGSMGDTRGVNVSKSVFQTPRP